MRLLVSCLVLVLSLSATTEAANPDARALPAPTDEDRYDFEAEAGTLLVRRIEFIYERGRFGKTSRLSGAGFSVGLDGQDIPTIRFEGGLHITFTPFKGKGMIDHLAFAQFLDMLTHGKIDAIQMIRSRDWFDQICIRLVRGSLQTEIKPHTILGSSLSKSINWSKEKDMQDECKITLPE